MPTRYYVVSPNVHNRESSVPMWKALSADMAAAFMGYAASVEDRGGSGKRFAQIEPGDVILIARRHLGDPDVVGFGRATARSASFPKFRTPDGERPPRQVRWLNRRSFVALDRPRKSAALRSALRGNMACHELHPGSDPQHSRICAYMDQVLGDTRRGLGRRSGVQARNLKIVPLHCAGGGYEYRTKRQLVKARAAESKLLTRYQRWLQKQGRVLEQLAFGRLRCDAFERKRSNLVEAKASIKREAIRMAVGQVLDYRYQGRSKFPELNLAVLLPKKHCEEVREWLRAVDISVIWPSGRFFYDTHPDHRFI